MKLNDTEENPLRGDIGDNSNLGSTSLLNTQPPDQAKRKKMIKYGLIGLAILIALILIIVLPIVLTRGPPSPPPPPLPDNYKPYDADPS